MSRRNTREAKARRRPPPAIADGASIMPGAGPTHEPEPPLPGWPRSHVRAFLTDDDQAECIGVMIHGRTHYLHATTAASLYGQLGAALNEYNAIAALFGAGVELD